MEYLYGDKEVKSRDMDLQLLMGELNKDVIDYDKVYRFMTRVKDGQDLMDENERKQMDEE